MKSGKHMKWMLALLFVVTAGIFFILDRKEDSGALLVQAPDERENLIQTEETVEKAETAPADETVLPEIAELSGEDKVKEKNLNIYVHVCGAVRKEGVYALSEDARVSDAIEAAGGLSGDAAGSAVNQAARVQDGTRVYIPTCKEISEGKTEAGIADWEDSLGMPENQAVQENQAGSGTADASGAANKLVNINTAAEAELMTLPGIGKAKAEAVIAYREANGAFRSKEDIMKIRGIKEGVYTKICDFICVE